MSSDGNTQYFAYGSNLDTHQMENRCKGARVRGKALLRGYRLEFAGDESHWGAGAVATLVEDPASEVHGLVYEVTESHLEALDGWEGVPDHYQRRLVTLADGTKAVAYIKPCENPQPVSLRYLVKIMRAYRKLELDFGPLIEAVARGVERSHR